MTPFIFIHEARLALRVSNGIAIAMLFMSGYAFGRYSGFRPGRVGLAMVVVGMAMGRDDDGARGMRATNSSRCLPWWFC